MDVNYTVLLLEDESEAAEMLANYLEMQGFDVLSVSSGKQALDELSAPSASIDLAILDIMVPEVDGIDVCRSIRKHPAFSSIPIIFLTARDQERDEIYGLEAGADDYIAKPASLKLIEARVKSLLRRNPVRKATLLRFGDITLDPHTIEAKAGGRPVELTHTEFNILKLFLTQPNKVYTRQEILEQISDDEKFVFDRTVDVHVKNLRIKLGESGNAIKTYRGTGYGMNRSMSG